MNYYDSIAEGYDELHRKEQLDKIKIMLKNFNVSRKKVLDVGCGTATYSYLFYDYTGIDNSKGMLKNSKANVIFGEAEKLPFEDKSFDIVISLSAVHNFKDYKKAIDEMKRVAKEMVIVTLLKKSKNFESIKKYFNADEEVDSEIDLIMVKII